MEELERTCPFLGCEVGLTRDVVDIDDVGKVGTVVDRTTYGQYDRCSLSRSNCRCLGGGRVITFVSLFSCWVGSDGGGGCVTKAHNPTRR